jgi:hypothetical protein
MSWKLVRSGGKNYTIQQSSSGYTVRKNDGFTRGGGTRIGSAKSLTDAIDIIKSDSNSQNVDIRDG